MEGMDQETLQQAVDHDEARRRAILQSQAAEALEAAYAKDTATAYAEVALLCAKSVLVALRVDAKVGDDMPPSPKKTEKQEIEWFMGMAEKALKLARAADSLGDLPAARMDCNDQVLR